MCEVKRLRRVALLILICCAGLCSAWDGGLPSNSVPVFSEVVRGNFSTLDIAPFRFRVVGTGYGEWGDYTKDPQPGSDQNRGFKTSVFGGALGGDWLITENCLAGLFAHAGRVGVDPEDVDFDGGVNSIGGLARIGLFGTRWYWDASVGVAANQNKAEFMWNGYECTAKKDLTQMNYQTELGLKLNSGFTKIEPFAGFRYITLSAGGLESFRSAAQKPKLDETPYSARSLLGSRFAWEYASCVATIRPSLQGIWVHEFGDTTVFTTDDTLLFPIAGEYNGQTFPRDRAVLGTGVSAALRDMVDLFFNYSCSYAPDAVSYSVSGGFHVKY